MEDMGMLKSISLENYKCFEKLKVDDKEELEIAPLTVLCGVNSSGKSSIIKSLLMLKQSSESSYDENKILLNGVYTKNGLFNDIVTNGKSDYFVIENSFIIYANRRYSSKQENNGFKELSKLYINSKVIKNVEDIRQIKLNFRFTIASFGENASNKDNNLIKKIEIKLLLNDRVETTMLFQHLSERNYKVILNNFPTGNGLNNLTLLDSTCYFEGLKIVNLFFNGTIPTMFDTDKALPNIFSIFRVVSMQYKEIEYIAPLRKEPQRRYFYDDSDYSVGTYGEFVAQILDIKEQENVIRTMPPVNDIITYCKGKDTLKNLVEYWLDYLGIPSYKLTSVMEMIKLNIGGYNILDVGFGISQVLPIIVSALLMNSYQTLILEQPEIHLHPSMQMSMADFLLEVSLSKRNIIVETHSEHIINRLVRRIIEDDTRRLKSNIAIYFIEQNLEKMSKIKKVIINDEIGIENWPDGFFDQAANEQLKIMQAGIKKRQKIRDNIL